MQVKADVFIPRINGTAGVFIAARVDRGGCDAAAATGVFFTIFPINGTFQVSSDLGMFSLGLRLFVLLRVSCNFPQ